MTNTSSLNKLEYESTHTPLPDHIIEENILIRLEVKPLIRLKSVSKGWFSMISGTRFTKKHLKLWYPSNDRSLIVQDDRDNVGEDKYYLSFDENYNVNEFVELRNKYPAFKFNTCVVGSCNGLLCMYNENIMRMYVWNPATNQVRDTYGPVLSNWDDFEMRCTGFGYVSSIDDYKIGCLIFHNETLVIFVYSLKNGLWIQKPKTKWYYELLFEYLHETSAFVCDTLYWFPNRIEDERHYIIGLDLVEEDLVIIPLSIRFPGEFATVRLFQMQGCLTFCLIHGDNGTNHCHVRRMTEYRDMGDAMKWSIAWENDDELDLNYIGNNFVYLFDTGKCLVNKISDQSQQLVLHELSKGSPLPILRVLFHLLDMAD
ncbi:F-box/kelch-repeat protein At3g23880-like [Chenopodium quinoa]|uniref:F-box/kelch-repeat protein At3g23880-like n=1 Tax=Chenopodium quinoa TaxID=63459 RepID=UPI000B78B499|nr:F-box/kelch-repeat protein At3g23880-like [Chenopodium quinoa]